MTTEELYSFAAEDEPTEELVQREPWKVLIVDDDEDVHIATKFALSDFTFHKKKLQFFSAYSAKDAKPILAQHNDIAVAFIDVIMETNQAGLDLVRYIRENLQNKLLRIVLRTGQPGMAPENSVIVDYDINDYKTKTELTASRLFSSMVTSLRSYQDLTSLNTAKIGLQKIAYGSSDLFNYRSMRLFAEGVITQLSGLFDMASNGLVLAKSKLNSERENYEIIIATGLLAEEIENGTFQANSNQLISNALTKQESIYEGLSCALFVSSKEMDEDIVVYCEVDRSISDLEIELIEVLSRNITLGFDNVHMVEELRTMVFTDGLTKLKNRHGCMFDAQKLLQRELTFHLVLLDIQNFSVINSYFGNKTGNDLLLAIADSVGQLLPVGSQVYRMNGDVFALLIDGDWAITHKLIKDIQRRHKQGLSVNDLTIPITFTFGCAYQDIESSVRAFERAEVALSSAKEHSQSFVLFDEKMNVQLTNRIRVLKDLYAAIGSDEFFMVYQPKICGKSQKMLGAEALLRWQPSPNEFISPADFIPIAEQSGHIIELGNWIINSVFAQVKQWEAFLSEGATISFNVSAKQLMEPTFVDKLAACADKYNVSPCLLQIELTETTIMENVQVAVVKMQELKKLGFSIAIDDFGTGYSSISYLLKLPFDVLKIDRSFVTGIDKSPELENLCRIIVEMGHSLGKTIVAEGVETDEELARLTALGCEVMQGYYFCKPITVDEFSHRLTK